MNDVDLMHCIERTRRSERRPDMLHILDEMAKRLVHKSPDMSANGHNVTEQSKLPTPLKTAPNATPCPVCEAARKRNIARQKRYREKHDGAAVSRD